MLDRGFPPRNRRKSASWRPKYAIPKTGQANLNKAEHLVKQRYGPTSSTAFVQVCMLPSYDVPT